MVPSPGALDGCWRAGLSALLAVRVSLTCSFHLPCHISSLPFGFIFLCMLLCSSDFVSFPLFL